jgi:hypothetical protein
VCVSGMWGASAMSYLLCRLGLPRWFVLNDAEGPLKVCSGCYTEKWKHR